MRERLVRTDDVINHESSRRRRDDSGRNTPRSGGRSRRNTVEGRSTREETDLRRAIEESKESARKDEQRRLARASGEKGYDTDGPASLRHEQSGMGARPIAQRQDSAPNLIELEDPQILLQQQQQQQQQYLPVINTGVISPQYTGSVGTLSPAGAISPLGAVSPQYTGMPQQITGYQQQIPQGYQLQVPQGYQQFAQPTGLQMPQQTGVIPEQTGMIQQPTGFGQAQQPQQYRPSPLASDFTGIGFGGYSSQQQQPNAMQLPQMAMQNKPISQPLSSQSTGMLQQVSSYQPAVSSPLASQPTGRNNPFRQA